MVGLIFLMLRSSTHMQIHRIKVTLVHAHHYQNQVETRTEQSTLWKVCYSLESGFKTGGLMWLLSLAQKNHHDSIAIPSALTQLVQMDVKPWMESLSGAENPHFANDG